MSEFKTRYRGHETFSIRKNWLAKGISVLQKDSTVFTDKSLVPMDKLGIGHNMVTSLRYWLKALGITRETRDPKTKKNLTVLTELGEIIAQNDPYVEESGTLWTLQYKLATNRENATSWYFFFNEFLQNEFSKDDFVGALQNFDRMNGGTTASSSFESDFECLVNTYMSRFRSSKEIDPEDNIESPFAELGLIDCINSEKKIYRKVTPSSRNIPPLIVFYALSLEAENHPNLEIPLSDIQNKKFSIGKAFNLDSIALMDILGILENRNLLHIIRTAGLDIVKLKKDSGSTCNLQKYYAELDQ